MPYPLRGAMVMLSAGLAASSIPSPYPEIVKDTFAATALSMLDAGIISEANRAAYEALIAAEADKLQAALHADNPYLPTFDGVSYLSTDAELRQAILDAKAQGKKLRVAGSQHSKPAAVFGDDPTKTKKVKLTGDLKSINVISQTADELVVEVGAGCSLGIDGFDMMSTPENSLFRTVDALGYAFPMTGGVSEQTVGGYLSTSTSGGSLQHTTADIIDQIQFMDGMGNLHTAVKGTDLFNAVGTSMGMLGVLTRVTFRLPPRFYVQGVEETVPFADSLLSSSSALRDACENNEYFRAFVWAQPGVNVVTQTYSKRVAIEDVTYAPMKSPFDPSFSIGGAAILWYLNVQAALPDDSPLKLEMSYAGSTLINFAVPQFSHSFNETWHVALPIDDPKDPELVRLDPASHLLRVQFSEFWVAYDDLELVYDIMAAHFGEFNFPNLGAPFFHEYYPAKESPFWMSMSYGHDMIRFEPFFWEYQTYQSAADFFQVYWDLLLKIPSARMHWGKWHPVPGSVPTSDDHDDNDDNDDDDSDSDDKKHTRKTQEKYLKERYPKYKKFMKLRKTYDPDEVFATDYWKGLLGMK
eukprot:TRINITY_DN109_c0_g1_i4.p1 TRINITY_DN109_c0_g1~~TRINITY_DN109_c0_g1_i4.p1  ORF type:complete len:600 (+),score=162.56 TRINITY_DN109_c0_g1_i4:56-1801(+)